MKLQGFLFLPSLRGLYRVRANVASVDSFEEYFRNGVLLSDEKRRSLLNPKVYMGSGHSEPFFPFNCFDFVS